MSRPGRITVSVKPTAPVHLSVRVAVKAPHSRPGTTYPAHSVVDVRQTCGKREVSARLLPLAYS
jgi:hypothetical protein